VAGLTGPAPFDARALRRVHALTGGVPRRINLLCDRALLGAYAQGRVVVDQRTIEQAAREAFGGARPAIPAGPGRGRVALLVAAAAVAVAAAGLGVAAALLWPAAAPVQVRGAATAASRPELVASASQPAQMASAAPVVAAVASAASASAPVAEAVFDPVADWSALPTDESVALGELARDWGAVLPPGGGCGQAPALGLACWRHRAGSLPLLRQLDRPVVLALTDGAGRSAHARLVALGPTRAVLASGTRRWAVPSASLAALWRGELVTLWRLPERIDPALAGASAGLGPGASGAAVAALRQALDRVLPGTPEPSGGDRAGGVYDAALRQRVAAFQLAAGLNPDGLTGPTTLMQLMRALAVDEPRLARE
jgi:general secretion pathway protein A